MAMHFDALFDLTTDGSDSERSVRIGEVEVIKISDSSEAGSSKSYGSDNRSGRIVPVPFMGRGNGRREFCGENRLLITVENVPDVPGGEAPNEPQATRNWRCALCIGSYTNKGILKDHSKFHEGLRKYICRQCPKQFKTAVACNIHYNTHFGNHVYACDRCDRKFEKKANFYKHKLMHLQMSKDQKRKKTWTCILCYKKFSKKEKWASHNLERPCLESEERCAPTRDNAQKVEEMLRIFPPSPSLFRFIRKETEMPDSYGSPPVSLQMLLRRADLEDTSDDSDGSIEDNNESSCLSSDSENSDYFW